MRHTHHHKIKTKLIKSLENEARTHTHPNPNRDIVRAPNCHLPNGVLGGKEKTAILSHAVPQLLA